MSEEDVREGLRDAVADEPPLDFDPDSLVDTARRATRRRALLAAVGATAAVVVAAVAVPVALSPGPVRVGAPPSTTSTSVSWPPPNVHKPSYSEGELRRHGKTTVTHLRRAVPLVLPAASEIEYGQFGGEATDEFIDGQDYMNAAIAFTVDGARYSLFVTLLAPGGADLSPSAVCTASGGNCEELGVQDGGPVMAKTEDLGEQTISTVYHFRADGGVVQVAAYNYDMSASSPTKYMPTVPVTLDQLRTLATDPELGL